jgi:hypothetical protein
MDEAISKYDVTPRELARGRNLKIAAWTAPLLLSALPAIVFGILFFLFGSTPPAAATFLFLGLISTAVGFVFGLVLSAIFAYRYANWSQEIRELIAADGIKAEEIEWFKKELKPSEKLALKSIQATDLLLADAYRETLASRLTASRIVKSSKRELALARRRESKLRYLKSENSERFQEEVRRDAEKLRSINEEAKQMLAEAESRLQMIDAAAMRGSNLVDSELALKKLSARTAQLPLALEQAKMAEEIRAELENETLDDLTLSAPKEKSRTGNS